MRKMLAAIAGASAIATAASGSVVVYSQQMLWEDTAAAADLVVFVEDFAGFNGFIPSPPGANGVLGGVAWNATAAGGLFAEPGLFSTNLAETAITFTFAPGVQGVGGNIFGTDINFNAVAAIVTATLADGTSYASMTNGVTNFAGFFSTGAAIESLTIDAIGLTVPAFVTISNLFIAVPAPGAIAVLAVAGVVGSRRRR